MDMRTPLGKVRGHGSARDGTQDFWQQRLSSLANIPLTLFFVWLVVSLNGAPHAVAVQTLSQPLVSVVLLAVIFSVAFHMKLGMQVIIEDYVHQEGTKIFLLILNLFFCIGVALIGFFAALKLGLGS